MALTLRRFETARDFAEAAMLFLLRHEAEHCLQIGIVAQAIENPRSWDGPLTFATVERDGMPVAVALRTPPFNPVLSRVEDAAAIPPLVDLFLEDPDVRGVTTFVDVGTLFTEEWSRRTGDTVSISILERIYAVAHVRLVTGVPGALRRATAADRGLLVNWTHAFTSEVFGDRAAPGIVGQEVEQLERRLASDQSGFAFWEDGGPVCLVGYTGPTPDGIRIGPVYTPPEHRRKGYASAAVAALSQQLLDEGRRFCVLFTDRDNATSNHIYQEIGYEPVAEFAVYTFTR